VEAKAPDLHEGDILLNRFSRRFYSSPFQRLPARAAAALDHQVAFTVERSASTSRRFTSARARLLLTQHDREWPKNGALFTERCAHRIRRCLCHPPQQARNREGRRHQRHKMTIPNDYRSSPLQVDSC